MAAWWATLSVAMKVLCGVTLAASLIFLIQTIATFIGADSSGIDAGDLDGGLGDMGGMDAADAMDGDTGGGSNLYTFRNLINFMLGFGWSMILLQGSIRSTSLLIAVSVLVGIGLVAIVMYMFRALSSMQQSGNINVYRSAVGCKGTAYLTIPGERSGEGKVQIVISDAVREYNAQTEGDTIKTGTPIQVTEVINGNTLLVETLEPEII